MFSVLFLSVSFLFASDESAFLNRIEALKDRDGLFLDRASDPTTVSSAATGFGVLALAEGASRGLRDTEEVAAIAKTAFEKTVAANPAKNRGWLSHFTDTQGNPKAFSEVSTIDTAIFYSGLLRAAELLNDLSLKEMVLTQLEKIDRDLVLRDGVFLHGFVWSKKPCDDSQSGTTEGIEQMEFIPYTWNDSSEGAILYRLFGMDFPMQIRRVDYPLFVYAYPLCFANEPNYEEMLQDAIKHQIDKFGYWGVTSTDGPSGYVTLDSNVISPVLIGAIATRFPQYLDPLKSMSINAAVVSMHVPTGWTGADDLTIDLASAYILFSRWSTPNVVEHMVATNGVAAVEQK